MIDTPNSPSDEELDRLFRDATHANGPTQQWIGHCKGSINRERRQREPRQRTRRIRIAFGILAAGLAFMLLVINQNRFRMEPTVSRQPVAPTQRIDPFGDAPKELTLNDLVHPTQEQRKIARSFIKTVEPLNGYLAAKDQRSQDDIVLYWISPTSTKSNDRAFDQQKTLPD